MIFVAGVWNLILHVVLEVIRTQAPNPSKNIYALLAGYIKLWTWPVMLEAKKLEDWFADERREGNMKNHNVRCPASAGLSLYGVICHFLSLMSSRWPDACFPAIEAYIALVWRHRLHDLHISRSGQPRYCSQKC